MPIIKIRDPDTMEVIGEMSESEFRKMMKRLFIRRKKNNARRQA